MPSARHRSPSPWLQWLSGLVQHHGLRRLNLSLTVLAVLLAALAGAAVATWAATGRDLLAAGVAGITCALAAPWLNALVLKLWCEIGRHPAGASHPAVLDRLTGVPTRLQFLAQAEREFARCRRYGIPGALLLIDADHFKRLNDQHGNACGDAALRAMAHLTQDLLRQPDLLGRFGGEELIVFLPHTDPLGALDVADRIRARIGGSRLPWRDRHVHVTVSVGVAAVEPVHTSVDGLIRDADMALYAAKEAGRNCVRAAPIVPRHGEQRRVPARK
jgi:diguanylate cyclase